MPVEVYGPDFAFLPRAELLSFEEIAIVARAFVDLGARTLRITGGEPLVRRHLDRLIGLLRAIEGPRDGNERRGGEEHWGIDLALTTNGSLLAPLAVVAGLLTWKPKLHPFPLLGAGAALFLLTRGAGF